MPFHLLQPIVMYVQSRHDAQITHLFAQEKGKHYLIPLLLHPNCRLYYLDSLGVSKMSHTADI